MNYVEGFYSIKVIDTDTGEVKYDIKNNKNRILPHAIPVFQAHTRKNPNTQRAFFYKRFADTPTGIRDNNGIDRYQINELTFYGNEAVCGFVNKPDFHLEDKSTHYIPLISTVLNPENTEYQNWSTEVATERRDYHRIISRPGNTHDVRQTVIEYPFGNKFSGTFSHIFIGDIKKILVPGYRYEDENVLRNKYWGNWRDDPQLAIFKQKVEETTVRCLGMTSTGSPRTQDALFDLIVCPFSVSQIKDDNGTPISLEIGDKDEITVTYYLMEYFDKTPKSFDFVYNGNTHRATVFFSHTKDTRSITLNPAGVEERYTPPVFISDKKQKYKDATNLDSCIEFKLKSDSDYRDWTVKNYTVLFGEVNTYVEFEPPLKISHTDVLDISWEYRWDAYNGEASDIS